MNDKLGKYLDTILRQRDEIEGMLRQDFASEELAERFANWHRKGGGCPWGETLTYYHSFRWEEELQKLFLDAYATVPESILARADPLFDEMKAAHVAIIEGARLDAESRVNPRSGSGHCKSAIERHCEAFNAMSELRDKIAVMTAKVPLDEVPPAADEPPVLLNTPAINQKPRKLLSGWHEIAIAVGKRHNEREKLKDLNDRFAGPIKSNGAGTSPMVYEDDLIAWWNVLADKQEELASKREKAEEALESEKLSVESSHNYGRSGSVFPEIKGSVKKRRTKKT